MAETDQITLSEDQTEELKSLSKEISEFKGKLTSEIIGEFSERIERLICLYLK